MLLLLWFFSGFCALIEKDPKKIVTLSTISQIGFCFLSIGSGLQYVSYVHIISLFFIQIVILFLIFVLLFWFNYKFFSLWYIYAVCCSLGGALERSILYLVFIIILLVFFFGVFFILLVFFDFLLLLPYDIFVSNRYARFIYKFVLNFFYFDSFVIGVIRLFSFFFFIPSVLSGVKKWFVLWFCGIAPSIEFNCHNQPLSIKFLLITKL
uniref:NADH dehydrogenase subunit 2 n=1 Tax=Elaeophora elaphi TaxID=1147741 RepID=A0A0R3RL55_9BILA